MKKVLFATSALVLSAGFASAEVAVSGDGRMGVIYDGNDAQFSSRARVRFTLTGESDAGLSFGGAFRVDQENYSDYPDSLRSAARGTAGAVWVSGTYGKLSMGDVVSASENAIGDLYEVGYTDGTFGNDIEEISYLTGDGENLDQGPSILYEYTFENFSVFASASDGVNTSGPAITGRGDAVFDEDGAFIGYETDVDTASTAWNIAAKYEADNFWVALGYAKHDDADEVVLGAEGTFNNFSVKGVYSKYGDRYSAFGDDGTATEEYDQSYGIALAYQMDAILIEGFYRRDEYNGLVDGVSDSDYDSFGIGAEYDLGGGAVLAGGIIDSDFMDDTVADLGVKFKF
ncbi:MAG TPA: porin [Paracoccus sp. (in: a-proteobacteria)]|uniref:porin n=1 Tax=Paracoccus sp. TaxID=267 RepID=UPI002CD5ACD7|nr:porin [Paracoccus sp. (in: a-proteobacteria)]HWL57904.1 porin [Paracoccus sp. (in: a-proteobacteria)]